MWLIVCATAALVSTHEWLHKPRGTDRLAQLSMVFWALTLMVFVDHVIGWFSEGAEGPFMDIDLNAFVLSLCMVIPILAIWQAALVIDRLRAEAVTAVSREEAKEID